MKPAPMPRFSVILPVFNAAPHLREALESIAAQTAGDFEAIAVDDGSTDESPAILAEWVRRDGRFRAIRLPENGGAAVAANAALDAARCAIAIRADADDVNEPERFATMLAAHAAHPEMAVISASLRVIGGGWRRYPETADAIRARTVWTCAIAHSAASLNRAVLGGLRYDPALRWEEDTEFWWRCVFRFPSLSLREPLVHYRLTPGGSSRTLSAERLAAHRQAMARAEEMLGGAIDREAATACHLGNRVAGLPPARVARHIVEMTRRAMARGLASPEALRREARRQCWWLWRYQGRQRLAAELPQLVAATWRAWRGTQR